MYFVTTGDTDVARFSSETPRTADRQSDAAVTLENGAAHALGKILLEAA
jgi:hypothetical protein